MHGNIDAVRRYIAKGINVNCKAGWVRAPPPPRAHHGERGPSPPRPPPRGARARPGNGEFCVSRAHSKGGVSATTRRSRRSRCRRNSFFAISGPPRAPRRRAFRGTFAASFRRARRRACSLLPLRARARRGGEGHGMRARLQRGGTEPSVTPLSLARVLVLSRAVRGYPVGLGSSPRPRRRRRDAHRRRGGRESRERRASRRRALVSRARALSLALSLSSPLSLSRERERAPSTLEGRARLAPRDPLDERRLRENCPPRSLSAPRASPTTLARAACRAGSPR